jgi:hypothetical protein
MGPIGDDLLERVAIRFNLAPLPAAYAMYGMVTGRVVGVAQKLGVFGVLLNQPATAGRVAEELELEVPGTRLLREPRRARHPRSGRPHLLAGEAGAQVAGPGL